MSYEIITALATFAFVSSITPGPNNLMLMASGANFGWRLTAPHMLGVGFGFVFMIFMIGLGLSQVFEVFPVSYTILKVFSIAFLLYLALKIATAAPLKETDDKPVGTPISFLQAAMFQWVNPKAWAMGLSAISAFTPHGSGINGVIMVALIFGVVNIPSINCWVFLGTQMRRFLNVPWKLRTFNVTAALLLLASLYPILIPH